MDPNMFWHPGVQWFFPAWRENDGSTIGSWKYVFKVLESLQIHGCKYPSMSRTNYSDLFARRWGSWIGKAPLTYPIIPADHWMGRWRTCKHGQAPTSLHNKFDDFQVICLEPKNPVIFLHRHFQGIFCHIQGTHIRQGCYIPFCLLRTMPRRMHHSIL